MDFLKCKITHDIMTDPVIASDGHTYEREAITEWLKNNDTSPITREKISNTLIPNLLIKSVLSDYETSKGPLINSELSDHETSTGLSICLVIDISGSMDCSASQYSNEPAFSRLDLVKHSVITIASMIRPIDNISIITFSEVPKIVFDKVKTDSVGMKKIKSMVESLRSKTSTNIPDALFMASNNNYDHIILLTDGENNSTIPARMSLEEYISNGLKNCKSTVHTIGLGMSPDLDTYTLRSISTSKNGMFSFCPDASMVGTVFIHLVANICVNEPGEEFPEYSKFVGTLIELYNTRDPLLLKTKFESEVLNEEFISNDPNKGQVEKAIKNWDKWGRHYLASFIDAHRYKFTTNFKDKSLQCYKSLNTEKFILNGEKIFAGLTPPVPSCNNYSRATITPQFFTSQTLDASGGCFGPDTLLNVECEGNYYQTNISQIRKGMMVEAMDCNKNISFVKVLCTVESPETMMIKINNFWISKKHPLYHDKKWEHAESYGYQKVKMERCFNLVLENGGSLKLEGDYYGVTFGHGLKGEIVEHNYLGSLIIDDFKKYRCYELGFIYVKEFTRSNEGFINGIEV